MSRKHNIQSASGLLLLLLLPSCTPKLAAKANFIAATVSRQETVRLDYDLSSLLSFNPLKRRAGVEHSTSVLPHAEPFRSADAMSAPALECLTAAVYYEARSESAAGQQAVAQVVLNRARHAAFPNTVCGVVFQGAQLRTGCQFSFTCDGSMRRRRDEGAWRDAQSIAENALQGHVERSVGLATHYHTHAVNPSWASSLRRLVTVGDHIFYSWRGAAGEPRAFRNSARLAGLVSAPSVRPSLASKNLTLLESEAVRPSAAPANIIVSGEPATSPGFDVLLEPASDGHETVQTAGRQMRLPPTSSRLAEFDRLRSGFWMPRVDSNHD